MKKHIKLLVVLGIILVGSFSFYLFKCYKKDALVYENNKIMPSSSGIAMMLETSAGSGNYEMTTRSEWPTEGYVFNANLSKCENGSELSWDNENKKVLMSGNKSDKCYVYFDKYNPIRINSYTITPNGNKITISISATSGTGTITKYFYSKDDGASYVESTSNTYTFTNLAKGTYKIKAYVLDSNNKTSEYISKNIEITSMNLSEYVMSQYTGTQGENNIYYHDANLTNGAGDNSYRYAGASTDVNNYICLGSSEIICPADNLYRIIGVFGDNNHGIKDQQLVKVIKNTSYGKLAWNTTKSNDWASASLNNATKTHTAKIGLMYTSDYGYATTPDYWTTNLYDYNTAAYSKDWLFLGSYEWLLSPGSGDFNGAWNVNSSGRAYNNGGVVYASAVRPSFYLLSSVKYVSGSGTSSLPIRIN